MTSRKTTLTQCDRYESPISCSSRIADESGDNILNVPVKLQSIAKKRLTPPRQTSSSSSSVMSHIWKFVGNLRLFRRYSPKYLRRKSVVHSDLVVGDSDIIVESSVISKLDADCPQKMISHPSTLIRTNTQDVSIMMTPCPGSVESTSLKLSPRTSLASQAIIGDLLQSRGTICSIGDLIKNLEVSMRECYHSSLIRIDWMQAYQDKYLTAIHSCNPTILEYAIRKTVNSLSTKWKRIAIFVCFRRSICLTESSRSELEKSMKKQGVEGKICVTIRYSDPRSNRDLVSFVDPILLSFEEAISQADLKVESEDVMMSLLKIVDGGRRLLDIVDETVSPNTFESYSKSYSGSMLHFGSMQSSEVEVWISSTASCLNLTG